MNEDFMENLRSNEAWCSAYAIQREAVDRYYELCAQTLGTACALRPLEARALSMPANLFSTLFMMATSALGLPGAKLRFYAVVNQCLRTVVTGCDNILDDEYKEVIPLDLSGGGTRFRSVLQIMTGDAVLARLMTAEMSAGRFDAAKSARLSQAVLAVLIPSGIQEHEEESRLNREVPTPEVMIGDILFRKTGLLFQAPLRLIEQVGDATKEQVEAPAQALSNFGIACQILDDAMDVAEDLAQHRLNLVLSLACHGDDAAEREVARTFSRRERTSEAEAAGVAALLPLAAEECRGLAEDYFVSAHHQLSSAIPAFDTHAAEALGTLVQMAIMKDRYRVPLGRSA